MVMDSYKFSYRQRLFVLLLVFGWSITAIFIIFQYDREKEYKVGQLNALLQYYNDRLADIIAADSVFNSATLGTLAAPMPDTRVTIIDLDGHVVFDNSLDTALTSNHLDRPEVRNAIASGKGYTVRRHSTSTDSNYFYSATRSGGYVVRSAVPYSLSLMHVLRADRGFLWFMLAITVVMSLLAWFATRSIGNAVRRLAIFARKAERGEKIYDEDVQFPRCELGEISHHIVVMYAERERQHEEALRQEREKIRIKKQLTNNINHELKTPLAGIQVCLETLLAHPELPQERKDEFLRRCYRNSERLRLLLADVSTLTRLDDGRHIIATGKVSIRKVIQESAQTFSAPDMLPIKVKMDGDVTLTGNASLLEAIFTNLIRNANAYSRGTAIDITVCTSGDNVKIRFADNGTGIAPEHLPHIFERFYRVDKGRSRATGGTGLGLSIVKNAVLFHGGTIEVSNRHEGGLQYLITLPLGGGAGAEA